MGQKVLFERKTTKEIENLPIQDGSLIYNIENGKTYMDYGTERIPTGGGANGGIYIGKDEPTDPDITLWVDTPISETKASEVVNTLDGNETNMAPSVYSVNNAFSFKTLFENSTNKNAINLPTKWTELYIMFVLTGGTKLTINILNKNLETENRFRTGYFLTSGSNGSAGVLISDNTIKFDEAYSTGNNVLSGSKFSVYYR